MTKHNIIVASSAVIAIGLIALLATIYLIESNGHATYTVNTTTTTTPTTTTAAQAPTPSTCTMLFYTISGSITGSAGINASQIQYNGTSITDYVLAPGASGTLHASEYISNVLNEPAGSIMNREHDVYLMHIAGTGGAVSDITTTISPENFTVSSMEHLNLTVTVSTNTNAIGTYLLYIDGPCGGGVKPILLTIGATPYSGKLPTGQSIIS